MNLKKRGALAIVRAVLFALVLREVKARLSINRLGGFWLVFEPLAHIAALLAINAFLRGRANHGVDLAMFLVTGIVPFLMFKNIALKGMEAVSANKALFAYKQIKPADTIVARTIVEFSLMTCIFVLIVFCLGFWVGTDIVIHNPLRFILAISIGVAFSFGLALIFCVIGEAAPEAKALIRIAFMPLYFLSGIILPLWVVPAKFLSYMLWNPFLHIVDGVRSGVFEPYPIVQGVTLWYPFMVSTAILCIGCCLYRVRRFKLVAI